MSARARALMRMARLLIALYPTPWRARYEQELVALLEDDPPSAGSLASLLAGAADAHLRPRSVWRASVSPATRMRLSLTGLFCCWVVLSLNGIGFQKDTEDPPFAAAAADHPLLAAAHDAILAGALLAAGAIAIGGLPLLFGALRQAVHTRERRLWTLLCAPALAVLCFVALTALLAVLSPARHGHFTATFVLSVQLPWQLGGCACAAVCALAPRWVLARVEPTRAALRRASIAGVALALAMGVIAAALLLYAIALPLQAGALAGESTAPVGASTGAMLAVYAAAGCLASVLAATAARRAVRAALVPV